MLSKIQRDFYDIAIQFSNILLNTHFQNAIDMPSDFATLDTASMITDTAAAGILLAGALTAPPTMGASVGIAGAIVILAKTGHAVYEWYQSFSDTSQEENYPALVKRDIQQLRMQVQLHRACYLFVIRYGYVLEHIVDEKSLYSFSKQTAERFVKIMLASLSINPKDIPNADTLLDGLLSSAKLSVTKKIDWVTIQQPRLRAGFFTSNRIPAKLLWACPQWFVYDEQNQDEYIGSLREHDFLSTTTLGECGVIAIRRDKLDLPKLAVNLKTPQSLTWTHRQESQQQLVKKLYFLYPLRRVDVQNYLDSIRQIASSKPKSLNQYLTESHGKTVIATCHDNELTNMDLRGGCFSGVDFHGADLSSCDLRNTDWSGRDTWLSNVIFDGVILDEHTTFQAAHLEESVWKQVEFNRMLNLSLAKFNGALIVDCTVNSNILLQVGTEWLLATFKNLTIIDKSATLERDFEEKLTIEQQQRMRLHQEIIRISQACDEQADALNTAVRQEQASQVVLEELKQAVEVLRQKNMFEYDARLNHIMTRIELLERAHLEEGDALRLFRQTEDERWSDQLSADLTRDRRISLLEPSQNIISRLWHYCKEEINTTSHKQLKRMYVELNAMSVFAGRDAEIESLTECLDRHINLGVDVILLHGETGCGKSFTLKLLFEELLKPLMLSMDQIFVSTPKAANVSRQDMLIPILLDFYRVQDNSHNSLRQALEQLFEKSQVDYLISNNHCFIMIDNADMSYVSFQKLLRDCAALSEHFKHKPKIIFSVKTSYLQSMESDYRDIFLLNQLNLSAEYVIQPFDLHQVKRFFRFYHEERIYRKLYELQIRNLEVRSMIKSPLMVNIIAGAFCSPLFDASHLEFRTDFYENSWRALYEHVSNLLPYQYKDYSEFTKIIQYLAITIFEQEKDWVPRPFVRRSLIEEQENPDLFGSLYRAKIGYLSFLLITKTRIRFMHESLGQYWIARYLFDALSQKKFLDASLLRLWNLRNLNEFPIIQNFLIELILKSPDRALLQQRLMSIVSLTKSCESVAIAAANAITIRCRLNRDFSGMDLSGTRIPDADLSEGLFVGTLFGRSQLNRVCFTRSCLLWSNMEEADLTNAQLLDATSFIQTKRQLKVFSVYPSLNEIIIALVVQPKNFYDRYKIRLISVHDGMAKKLKDWVAHTQSIYTMSWSVVNQHAILASAGEGGIVRIWIFGEDASITKEIKCYAQPKGPISSLVWGPSGHFIAAGSMNGHVHIWTIDTQRASYALIYSVLLNASVRSLVWKSESHMLIALDAHNHLSIWRSPEQPMPQERLQRVILKDIFPDIKPVFSMALSLIGSQLALGLVSGEIIVIKLDDASLKPLMLYGHKREVRSLCWAGPMLISSSADHTVRMWLHAKFSKILQHEHPVERVEVLPSGRGLISGVGGQSSHMYFWNISLPNEDRVIDDRLGVIKCLAVRPVLSNTSIDIAVGYVSGSVLLYNIDMKTKQITTTPLWEHEHVSVSQIAWSVDGRFLSSFCKDGAMVIKDLQNIGSRMVMIRPKFGIDFQSVAWLKHQDFLSFFVAGLSDGSIGFYDALRPRWDEVTQDYTLDLLHQIPSNAENFLERLSVSSSDDHSVAMLAVSGVACIDVYRIIHLSNEDFQQSLAYSLDFNRLGVTDLVWSVDNNYLASVLSKEILYVWRGQEKCFEFKAKSEIKCIKWQGQQLIVGCVNQLLVWDTALTDVWTRKPTDLPIGGCLFEEMGPYHIVAENKGICMFERNDLFANRGASSWVMQVKPDLLLHQVNISKARMSPSAQEFMRQKGAIDRNSQRFTFFPKHQEPVRLPKPSTLEELDQVLLRQFSSQNIVLCDDRSESSNPSPRVRAASSSSSIKG